MLNTEFSEAISETLDILKYMEKSYIDKIPKKLRTFLEKNKSESYTPNLDHSQKLNEMNLKEKTKDILATIYLKYWCSTEEKTDYLKILSQNEKKYQDELREKYNTDNIFKKHIQENKMEESTLKEEVALVECKESIFKRFINKIRSIFNIK